MSYRLTKKAAADLAALIDFSLERFGSDTALRHLERLERGIEALDRGGTPSVATLMTTKLKPRWRHQECGGQQRPVDTGRSRPAPAAVDTGGHPPPSQAGSA